MSRQRIDHRHLLEHVLPRSHLPNDVREAVESALAGDDGRAHEAATRRAIDALVSAGVLAASAGTGESGVERYVNRESGDTLSVRWSAPAPPLVKIPIPTGTHTARVSLDVVHDILSLDETLFRSESAVPASIGEIIRSALSVLTRITGADYVTFVPGDHSGSLRFAPLQSDDARHLSRIQRFLHRDERCVLYLADARVEPDLHALAPDESFSSVVLASVGSGEADAPHAGYVEAWSRRRDFLARDALVAVGLFADQLSDTLRKVGVLERLVYHDTLTGLYNRHFFNVQMKTEMARARRAGNSFALAIVDLDDFKTVNTRFGYYGGNDLLVQVARLLKSQVRPFDIAARWGGEEFGLILTPPVGATEALAVCNRLREAVASHPHSISGLDLAKHEVTLSLSIGVALFPDDGETGKRLWTTANAALGAAKSGGKNRVVYAGGLGSDVQPQDEGQNGPGRHTPQDPSRSARTRPERKAEG